jgi:hypothetical protein
MDMDRRTFERLFLQDDVERRALMREVERKRNVIRKCRQEPEPTTTTTGRRAANAGEK